jgi:hypothetical protein
MLRHVVLFSWTPEATEEQKQRMSAEMGALPAVITQIRGYKFGRDAGINQGNYDFALVADFDDVDDYRAYRDDPVHRAFIENHINPIVGQRVAVQYEV